MLRRGIKRATLKVVARQAITEHTYLVAGEDQRLVKAHVQERERVAAEEPHMTEQFLYRVPPEAPPKLSAPTPSEALGEKLDSYYKVMEVKAPVQLSAALLNPSSMTAFYEYLVKNTLC